MRLIMSILILYFFIGYVFAQQDFIQEYIYSGRPIKVVFGDFGFTDNKWIGKCGPDIVNKLCRKTYTGRYIAGTQTWEFETFNENTDSTMVNNSQALTQGNPQEYKLIIWDEEFSFDEKGRVFHPADGVVADLSPIDYTDSTYIKNPVESIKINTGGYRNEGFDYLQNQDYQEAINSLNKAIEQDPRDPFAYYYRGFSYLQLEDYSRAIPDLEKATILDSTFSEAYGAQAVAYLKLNDYEEAVKAATKAIIYNPKDATSLFTRGVAYNFLGKYEQAYRDFDEAANLDPTNRDAITNRDLLLKKLTE